MKNTSSLIRYLNSLDGQELYFLQRIDAEKHPEALEKEVTRIFRIKARDYSSKTREQKEFIYWSENWFGKDWLNRTVAPVTGHIEGRYNEQEAEPVYNNREKLIGYKRTENMKFTIFHSPKRQ